MTSPYQLCLAHDSDPTVEELLSVCFRICVGDFVLPANLKVVMKASEVEVVQLLHVPPVAVNEVVRMFAL